VPGVVWWEVETPDPEAFRAFYGSMWGWTFEPAFEDSGLGADYWVIRADGDGIGGLQRAATSTAPHAGARIYLAVADLEATMTAAEELGARVERPRTALGGDDRWCATFLDPAGVSLGLWTANPPVRMPTSSGAAAARHGQMWPRGAANGSP
jgi:predicted enzyme related to lactoylglutathione lyase